MGNVLQYIHMTPVLHYIRFGKWDELLKEPQPASEHIYGNILYHFGRGMALANRSRMAEAKQELAELQQLMKDSSLQIPLTPFSPVIEGAITAEHLLIGTIALKENRKADAITAFDKAVVTEENMIYTEPRDWMLNPKHFLGNAYLQNKDGVNAEKIFRKDLLNNNENGWALYGLFNALVLQKKTSEAAKVLARFKTAFNKADIKIISPVF